ncbi:MULTISPECIES: GNAT family N-acetyltransferase [unclassified Flavobacterium]|uniref:GNAT family N-acetyltransferase n=1 Tax=unclassified Flavobacterium TaxID=196869 RepID=UPI000F0C54C9|nr:MULTISPECIES: GNAT family N-acetyltransferase [unclassified Flavobacterium]AYN04011.1 GNAT family N-acetyltransferase [Flavobacterium sp. 140616W15]MCD0476495.1 GNAT family N-acetyltransferase [Flavobacterium sp. EDS]
MIIRKATINDSNDIVTYLLLAMEDIVYKFIGKEDYNKAKDFLLHFVEKENNQYSYKNCFVVEDDNEIVAAVNIYDGAKLHLLREPIAQYVRTHYNKNFNPEDETQKGEIYIDTLGVNPKCQGKGIGSKLLQFLIDEYVTKKHKTLGLLVDEGNPNAKKLYLKLGFKPVGVKTLVGKRLEHLQIKG